MLSPPPLIATTAKRKRYEWLARFSWLSVVIGFLVTAMITATIGEPRSLVGRLLVVIILGSLALCGVLAGCVALSGLRQHGRRAILWPAAIGLGVWLSLLVIAVKPRLKARESVVNATRQQGPEHVPGTSAVRDDELGFAFNVPDGFQPFPESERPQGYRHAFVKEGGDGNLIILVKALKGVIPRERLKPEQLPPGSVMTLTSFSWRGLEIDAFRVPERAENVSYVTFNVQVPLRKRAVQFGFSGPANNEAHLRATVEGVLASLVGEANW